MRNKFLFWLALALNLVFLSLIAGGYFAGTWLFLGFFFNLISHFLLRFSSRQQWKKLNTMIGNGDRVGDLVGAVENYFNKQKEFLNQIHIALKNLNKIGQAEFVSLVSTIDSTIILEPLLSANDKIMGLREKENDSNWIAQGVAAIAELKHKSDNVSDYCSTAISMIVKYLNANQGGFFLLKSEGDDIYFESVAAYAYGKRKYVEKKIKPGVGLIGQVYYEKEIIHLTDVPKDYIKITSGLGEALPNCVCIIPLIAEGQFHGALEIASFKKLNATELEYLKKIGESIGYNLGSIENQKKTETLLKESQKMADGLKVGEEELRQNMEELTATQEQMRRKQDEMNSLLASLSVIELDLEGKILDANLIFTGATGYALSEIVGKHYNYLTQNDDPAQFEIMWSSITSGRSFSGEFKIVNREKKEIWMAGNFTPILNEINRPYKVTVISVFTTRDKEKMTELQEMVSAFKSCLPVAEINEDMSFKSASDLFLLEMGIKRLELKKILPESIFREDSLSKLHKYLQDMEEKPNNTTLDIVQKDGSVKVFNSTLCKLSTSSSSKRKRGLVILKNIL